MKYKLKKGLGQFTTNYEGHYYRLTEHEYREYPQAIISMYGEQLIPEHETKTKKQAVNPEPETAEEQI